MFRVTVYIIVYDSGAKYAAPVTLPIQASNEVEADIKARKQVAWPIYKTRVERESVQ